MPSRTAAAIYKDKARSRVTNGRSLLPKGADGRSLWVRRMRDLLALHLNDLGGEDAVSEGEKAIVRRAATIIVALERMEFKFATQGEASTSELETYQRLSNTLRRLLQAVGLERRSRDITPTLDQYLASKRKRPPRNREMEDD
jgi:hypothetical protein